MRDGSGSPVDQEAATIVDILTRLQAIEKLGHVHRLDGVVPADRNLLDNGMFKVNQIGNVVSNNNSVWGADRWVLLNTISTPFVNLNASTPVIAPSLLGASSRHGLVLQNTTFKTPLSAGDYFVIRQGIEGYRLEGLHWGTPAAEPLVLQYFVQTSRAVTFAAQLVYTPWRINQLINVPAGLSRLVVTFPGHTTLAVVPDNSAQLYADLWLAAGSTYNDGNPAHILGPVWSNTFTNVQVASGITNYWDQASQQLTVIEAQLEPGMVATPVESRPYQDELRRCMRYYRQTRVGVHGEGGMYGNGVAGGTDLTNVPFPVPMRAAPVPSVAGTWTLTNCTGPNLGSAGNGTTEYSYAFWYAVTAAGQYSAYPNNSGYLIFDARI